ncbi:hypothetical protein STEG23_011557, partial [Scotinomys teguina]
SPFFLPAPPACYSKSLPISSYRKNSSLSSTGLLELNLVFGYGALHLLPSVTGERLYDDN